jgi:hypothetical protein
MERKAPMKRKVIPKETPIVVEEPVAARRMTPAKRASYFIANNHTGDIVFPRKGRGALKTVPLTLPAGQSVIVDGEEWIQLKLNKSVRNYLDAGLISEVSKVGEVPVMSQSSTDLPIPEHLLREEEMGKQTDVKATVRRKTASRITV